MSFLDTLKVLGVKAKDDIGGAALDLTKTAATVTIEAAADVIRNAGKPTTAANGTIKQPKTGVNADGTPVVVLPDNAAVTAGGQIVPPVAGIPPAVLYGGGALLLLVSAVVIVKLIK